MSLLTGFAQTRSSWARLVETYDEVPDAYRSFFEARPELRDGPFPYVVFCPTYEGYFVTSSDVLLVGLEQYVYVLKRRRGQVESVGFAYNDARCVERGAVLLKSWLTITGGTTEGDVRSATIIFNTARESLITPFIERLRPTPMGDSDRSAEQAKLASLLPENYKMANLARLGLRAGEGVRYILLQPERRVGGYSLLGQWVLGSYYPAHISVLTQRELVTIRDEGRPGHKRYGTVWRYLPVDKIAGISQAARPDGRLALVFDLQDMEPLELGFSTEKQAEAEALQHLLSHA